MNDKQYPWCILVPNRENTQEIYQLSQGDQQDLIFESSLVAEGMMRVFQGDKMNIGALGNLVPQLHIHHIVRAHDDPAWPGPVWGKLPAKPYQENELNNVLEKLKTAFSDKLDWSDDL